MEDEQVKRTVLVVDDETSNIDLVTRMLSGKYLIKAARSGKEALEVAFSGLPPDLILLDVVMPGMDGYDVCKTLKEDPRTRAVPVIFLTGKDAVNDQSLGFSVGGTDYITKPANPHILKSRLQAHLGKYDAQRSLERDVMERSKELQESQLEVVRALARCSGYKDDESVHHTLRVGHYARIMAAAAGMVEADVQLIQYAAPLHDVGKIGVPDAILQKPGKLAPHEWSVMKEHPVIGAELMGDFQSPLVRMAATISLTHHEKWNGSGYPRKLAEEAIPLVGRITAIADVFDILSTKRPYRQPLSVEQAIEMVKKGTWDHFDPTLVKVFLDVLPKLLEIRARFPR